MTRTGCEQTFASSVLPTWMGELTPICYEVLVVQAVRIIEAMNRGDLSTDEALAEWRIARMKARSEWTK